MVLLTLAGAHLLWSWAVPLQPQERQVIGALVLLPVFAAAALLAFRTARSRRHTGWKAIGWGLAVWGLGQAVYSYYVLRFGAEPFLSPALLGFVAIGPCFAVGILQLYRVRCTSPAGIRTALDVGIMVVAAALWLGCLNSERIALTYATDPLTRAGILAYVFNDLALLALLLLLSLQRPRHLPVGALLSLAGGVILMIWADLLYALLSTGTYWSGGVLDSLWVWGAALVGLAAYQSSRSTGLAVLPGTNRVLQSTRFVLRLLPYVSVVACLVACMVYRQGLLGDAALAATALVIAGLLVRQALTLLENARLIRRLRHTIRDKALTRAALKEREKTYGLLAEHASDLVTLHAPDGTIVYASPSLETLLGYAPSELVGQSAYVLVHPDDLETLRTTLRLLKDEATCTYRMRHRQGHDVWLETRIRPIHDPRSGRVREVQCASRDVTAHRRSEAIEQERLQLLERIARNEPLEELLEALCALIAHEFPGAMSALRRLEGNTLVHVASHGLPEALHRAWARLTIGGSAGVSGAAVADRQSVLVHDLQPLASWNELYRLGFEHGIRAAWALPLFSGSQQVLGTMTVYFPEQKNLLRRELERFQMVAQLAALAIEHHDLRSRLNFHATHDALTGLPNRTLLSPTLEEALRRADHGLGGLAVLFVDLDRFKTINDSLGHAVGDELLRSVAHRLRACVSVEDTVARVGGDEFVLILPGCAEREQVERAARRVIHALTEPLIVQGHELRVTASVGVSLYPRDGRSAESLIRRADMAMYRAKREGKNDFRFFELRMNEDLIERRELESELRLALERGDFLLHYQPQVDLSGRKLRGFEALLRWPHARMGWISPMRFIPVAEETGLIVELGEWVIREAVRQIAAWRAAGLDPLPVAVNVSALHFANGRLVESVRAALEEYGVPGQLLEVEITEGAFLEDPEACARQLEALRALGVSAAVDDFGTGYSSLAYLRQLPVVGLKIDRSFVGSMDSGGEVLVRSIISLAHAMNLWVVAEGIETEAQLGALRALGSNYGQGFLFSRPVGAVEVEAHLARGPVALEVLL